MFSILGPRIREAAVLDLCCGSGGLGIEALSRGARQVAFVDRDRSSLLLAGRNLAACGAREDTYQLVTADAVDHFQQALPRLAGADEPWILLADPPYRTESAGRLVAALLAGNPGPGFRAAVIEHDDGKLVEEASGGPWRIRNRRYGKTILTVLERG